MMKWYIIGGVLVVLMVAFGSNPMEAKKKTPASGDKLLNAVKKYQNPDEDSPNKWSLDRLRSGNSRGNEPMTTQAKPLFKSYGTQPGAVVQQPGYMPPSYPQQPGAVQQAPTPGYAPQAPQSPYPAQQLPPNSNFQMAPPSHNVPNAYLRSGEQLKYAGTYVYMVSANGVSKPLPDGEYAMLNSNYILIIKDGERQILSN